VPTFTSRDNRSPPGTGEERGTPSEKEIYILLLGRWREGKEFFLGLPFFKTVLSLK
jgi:hypothetical protein